MTYFILAARNETDAAYHVAFGDYDRATVSQEASDLAYGGDYRRVNMKVLKAARATQRAVDAALAELNASASRAIAAQSV
jgi:hypothetical protein